MKQIFIYILSMTTLLFCLNKPGLCNDSMADIKAGGLVLKQTQDIRMVKEDLYLSLKEVRVSYVFENISASDITTTVAFPVPDIPANPEGDINIDLSLDNPLSFSVMANGLPIPVRTEKKNVGDKVVLTYFWEQIFPAKKQLTISHRYLPAYGSSQLPINLEKVEETIPYSSDEKSLYCMDPGFVAASKKMIIEAVKKDRYPQLTFMGYILTTGSNWKGPIGEFNLIIEKVNEKDLLSLCINGIKKTGPKTFEVHEKNYVPKKDIAIAFLLESFLER